MRGVLFAKSAMRKALVLSIGVHAVIFGVTRPIALRTAAAEPALLEPTDRWTGTTAELPGAGPSGEIFDVSLDPPAGGHAEPATPPIPATPAPAIVEPAAPALPAPPAAPAPKPPPARERTRGVDAAARRPDASLVPPPSKPRPPRAPRTPAAASADPDANTEPAEPPRRRTRRAGANASGEGTPAPPGGSAAGPGGAAGSFGAEGPASARDLRYAFKRAIPAACQSDGIWSQVPLGATDTLEVEIDVDDAGHITRAEPRAPTHGAHGPDAPPQALVHVLRRTIPLLEAGTFAVTRGKVSAGTEVLALRATVSEVANPTDELSNDPRTASFTQPSGRHVEVSVTVLRTSVR